MVLASPLLPLPTSWGWIKTTEDIYEPNWTTLPEASKVCYLASARRAVLAVASARRLHLSALHCACVKENVLMVELVCIMYACHHIFIVLNHSSLVLAIFATILECVIAKYLVVFPNFTPLSLNVHRHVVNYHNLRKV